MHQQTEAEDLADLRHFESSVRVACGYHPDSQEPPDSASVIAGVQSCAAMCKRLRADKQAADDLVTELRARLAESPGVVRARRLREATELILRTHPADSPGERQWVADQLLRTLTGDVDSYESAVARYREDQGIAWEQGAP